MSKEINQPVASDEIELDSLIRNKKSKINIPGTRKFYKIVCFLSLATVLLL